MTAQDLPAPTTDRGGPGPYDSDEYAALFPVIWSFDGCEDDLTRFDELLTAALVFLGRIALSPTAWSASPRLAAELLRSMEQRALWGPDHPVRQP